MIKIILCFSFLLFVSVAPSIFAETQMTGRINIMDSYSPTAGPHPYIFWFQPDDQDHPYRLNPNSLPSNILNFAGERVRIIMNDSKPIPLASSINPSQNFMDISSIEQLNKPSKTTPLQIPASVRSVTLLNKFNDVSTIPLDLNGITSHTKTYYQNIFYDNSDSLKNYYLTSSYGKFSWSGSVDDWTTLPKNQAAYDFNFDLMISDTISAHDATVNFCNPTPVTSLILIFNGNIDASGSAFGSLGTWTNFPQQTIDWPTNDGCSITISVSWQPDDGWFCCGLLLDNAIGVTAHELGHNQGFEHTPPPPGGWSTFVNDPYHDPWSIMSTNRDSVGPSALVTGQRDQVGWMDAGNKVTISSGTISTITLDYLNEPEGGINPQMAIVPITGGSYIIEAHTDSSFDDTPNDNEGALLYRFFPSGNQYSYLTFGGGIDKSAQYSLVATAGTASEFDFDDANLDVGEIFIDAINSVTVRTDSKTSTSVTVSVSNNGGALPGLCSPPPGLDWIITSSCTLTGSVVADKNVTIQNNSILTIPNGFSLDIDFSQFNLTVKSGSGVLIESGGSVT